MLQLLLLFGIIKILSKFTCTNSVQSRNIRHVREVLHRITNSNYIILYYIILYYIILYYIILYYIILYYIILYYIILYYIILSVLRREHSVRYKEKSEVTVVEGIKSCLLL